MVGNKRKGFTLIEVVIVLAIAALIMVVVFLGVSGAQKAQRDSANKSAASKVVAAYTQYLGDNNNVAPGAIVSGGVTTGYDLSTYIANIKDTKGNVAVMSDGTTAAQLTATSSSSRMYYLPKGTCTASTGTLVPGTTASNVAVMWWSESAGSSVCISN